MEPLGKTFICWPIHSIETESQESSKLPFMYLKMNNDGIAELFHDFELKSMAFNLKIRPQHSATIDETSCFEADITDELRSWLKPYHMETNDDESKIKFTFHQDGTMGHVLYNLRSFT